MVTLNSAQVTGLTATLIAVEVDLSPGLHLFSIVGLADKEVQESRERISAAIKNLGARPPYKKSERVIVNLAPADIKKEGPAFDLPIALGFLLASDQMRFDPRRRLFVGELGLDGSLKPVAGILPMAIAARLAGFEEFYVPTGNGPEAALVQGIAVKEAPHLKALIDDLEGRILLSVVPPQDLAALAAEGNLTAAIDFSYVHGQEQAKRALEIAAAGGHNLLLEGPPGTGKTLLARAITTILPPMSAEEIIEVTTIYSVAGALKHRGAVLQTRPFRSPHHTASAVAIAGGGSLIRPGEVTLAHRGVLFLDELPEFQAHVLESLRQPLEDKVITVARASGSTAFPADFILVAARNPCPCGNLGNPRTACTCTPGSIARYQRRISGPLLDRIDLILEVPSVEASALETSRNHSSESTVIRERVTAARRRQRERFRTEGILTNSAMTLRELKRYCVLDNETKSILREAYERFGMSVRSYYRVIRVARTIADLAGVDVISREHVLEALQYRPRAET